MLNDEIVVLDMSISEVKSAVMKLGLLRDGIEGQFAKYIEVVSSLYERRAWIAAGVASWEEFVQQHDILVSLPQQDRQAISVALSEGGMSTRAIAATQGVSHVTIGKDISAASGNPVTTRPESGPKRWRQPVRDAPEPHKLTAEEREALWPNVIEMASNGFTSEAINRSLRMYSDASYFRSQAKERGITIQADSVMLGQRKIVHAEVMERMVFALASEAEGLAAVDVYELPVEQVEKWLASMKHSITTLSKARRRIEAAFTADSDEPD
ncbi:hypothetical protein C1I63_13865 [Rathayibacter caricis DSM 15933]|uniref:Uncharacterized protein n=1 Tax=Rathayibacter caricis DSM 15933 TaxID=1328867 RepID=A0A2T4UWA8_9MICO|nr:hypothetical protein [Rathayibacter caricis]PTL73816.1 hypothetical protein C1I63_13865 [Rathayibacter caricis DSM 15933]